jgi:hypothetical protein
MALAAVIDTLRTHVSGLTGMRRVYVNPPESMGEYPCAIVYGLRGSYEANAAGGRALHTIVVEVHHSRQFLPDVVDAVKVWPDRMYTKLKTVSDLHIVWPMPYQLAALSYANETHYGARFEITVKVNEA